MGTVGPAPDNRWRPVTLPTDHIDRLVDELRTLLTAPPGTVERSRARIEDALTAGYAQALALEAERWRLERRLTELAAGLADGDDGRAAQEMARLARRMSRAEGDLTSLRELLASVRERAADLGVGAVRPARAAPGAA